MWKILALAGAFVLTGTACVGGGDDERTILVDFSHDEFASIMVGNFPGEVEVTQGMTLVFKQTWTGEPHTVTGGTLVNQLMAKAGVWTSFFGPAEALIGQGVLPNPENPEGSLADALAAVGSADDKDNARKFLDAYDGLVKAKVPVPARDDVGDTTFEAFVMVIDEKSDEFFSDLGLPWALDDSEDGVYEAKQNAGQPCYLNEGAPPKDADEPCRESQQRQPVFDGSASYYNSGIIPYEGPQGNTFRVRLAQDIKPGSYFFYCAVHGPQQATEVKVRPSGTKVPPQSDVSRQARKEIAEFAEPMLKAYRDARDNKVEIEGQEVSGPFGGLAAPVFGAINEFFPKTIRTKVGERVTWKLMGWDHSVSFDVPPYFPIIRFAEDGTVSLNPQLHEPAGGSPEVPEQEGRGPLTVDGGTYDGSGFFSSALMSAEPYAEYSLRFSKPGTYKYACLLHPPMVGTVVVTQ